MNQRPMGQRVSPGVYRGANGMMTGPNGRALPTQPMRNTPMQGGQPQQVKPMARAPGPSAFPAPMQPRPMGPQPIPQEGFNHNPIGGPQQPYGGLPPQARPPMQNPGQNMGGSMGMMLDGVMNGRGGQNQPTPPWMQNMNQPGWNNDPGFTASPDMMGNMMNGNMNQGGGNDPYSIMKRPPTGGPLTFDPNKTVGLLSQPPKIQPA